MYFKKNNLIFLLVIPALIVYTLTLVVPVMATLPFSMFKWDGISMASYTGFRNFYFLLHDKVFYQATVNTLEVMIVATGILIPLGFSLAVLLRRNFFGNEFYKIVIFLPVVIAPLIAALSWSFILEPVHGLINNVLNKIGLEFLAFSWIGSNHLSLLSVSVVTAWGGLGINMVIMLAGIRSIPNELYEAAEIDGASSLRRALGISLPLIREQILMCLIIDVTGAFKIYELVYFLTGGGPGHQTELLSTYMFKVGFNSFRYGYGAAIAFFILILGLVFSFASIKLAYGKKWEM